MSTRLQRFCDGCGVTEQERPLVAFSVSVARGGELRQIDVCLDCLYAAALHAVDDGDLRTLKRQLVAWASKGTKAEGTSK